MTWRPKNETQADLDREERARIQVCARMGVEITKLSEQLYGVDWVLHRGKECLGFAEYKRRSELHDPYMVSLAKYLKLRDLADGIDMISRLFVEWDHGLYVHRIHPGEWRLAIEVRGSSRGQNGDIEPMVMIPYSSFSQV